MGRSYNGTYQGLNMAAGATGSFIPYNPLLTFLKSASDTSILTLQEPQGTSDSGNLRKTLGLPMAGQQKASYAKTLGFRFLPSCFLNTTLPTDNVSTFKTE